ncbi:DUF4190 domain-containing protein [Streptomyces indicus]|uniref:Septum formation n=1 Tax=Streptomyces indicus TaxID=417292 RepID=A0A1G9G0C8_9ACTN|nr:DUF4190 domain-containing protein [Streptomyces indicus]SDK94065.1 protein of unknown function [Streptomyces indicus]
MAIPPPPQDNPYGPPQQSPQQPQGQIPQQQPQGQVPPQQPYGQGAQAPYGQPPQAPYHQNPQTPYGQNPQNPQQSYGQNPQAPYGQQPQGPYPGYGNGWQPYPSAPKTSGLAIAALVTCVLCFLPLGLVFGLVALRQTKRSGQSGRGLAISGIVVNAVTLALTVLFFVSGAAGDFWDGFRDGVKDAQKEQIASPDKGECFNAPGGELEGLTYELDVVPCSEPHDGEAFGSFELDHSEFPGQRKIDDLANDKCGAMVEDYVGDIDATPEDTFIFFYSPTQQSWRLGDREVTCILGKENGGKTTGSLRDAGGSGGSGDSGGSGSGGTESEAPAPGEEAPAPGEGAEV